MKNALLVSEGREWRMYRYVSSTERVRGEPYIGKLLHITLSLHQRSCWLVAAAPILAWLSGKFVFRESFWLKH